MRERGVRRALWAAACVLFGVAAGHAAAAPALTLAAYRGQLAAWRQSVEGLRAAAAARTLAARVPAEWDVAGGGTVVRVPAAWLGKSLQAVAEGKLPLRRGRSQLAAHLAWLAAAAQAPALPAATWTARRRALSAILARREFASVHGVTLWDQINAVIARTFAWLFSALAAGGTTRGLAWAIVVLLLAAAGFVVFTVARPFGRGRRDAAAALPAPETAAWREWLRRAQALAPGGDGIGFAVCAYQAGLGYGEAAGWWANDATATPREYLRRLPGSHPARAAWRKLVAQFEALRYAGAEAGPAARARLLQALEELGCR